jgi:Domain of unknown function (DUF4352)/Protein of unknown function (DUF3592)
MSNFPNTMGSWTPSGYPGMFPTPARVPPPPLILVLVPLVLLTILAIPTIWWSGANWYIQIAGHQAQGVESIVADCGDDDGTETYTALVLFQDDQGRLHEIPPNGTCTNFYSDGATVAVWYLPNDPTSAFVGNGVAIFFYVIALLLLGATIGILIWFVRSLWAFVKISAQAGALGRLWRLALVAALLATPLLVAVHFFPPDQTWGPERNYHIGETAAIGGNWLVTVQGGHPVQAGLVDSPKDGTACVELDMTVRNPTSQALAFDPNQFTLYDANKQAVDTTCSVETNALQGATLGPGETVTGALVYDVPLTMHQIYLAFQPNPQDDSSAPYFWKIHV